LCCKQIDEELIQEISSQISIKDDVGSPKCNSELSQSQISKIDSMRTFKKKKQKSGIVNINYSATKKT